MNRDVTNVIRYFMDEWVPPIIRDSRWFMYPWFWIAYRGKNVDEVMDFKRRVHGFTRKDYERFYNSLDTISRHRQTDLNGPSLRFILDGIDNAARTLIDVGCGNGFLLRAIRDRYPALSLTGFDIIDRSRDAAFHYVKGDIKELPFADKAFDVVTCCHTIEHLTPLEPSIRELVRIARRQLFIVTPCQRYYYLTLDEHVNFFPFREALTTAIPIERFSCEKMKGDWVYLGTIE